MKFDIDRTDFIRALDSANKATAGKQMTALGDVYIKAAGNMINITGYNLSTAIFTYAAAKVSEPGEICCSADTILRFLQKCDDVAASVSADTKMTVKCGRSKVTVAASPADDYPKVEHLPDDSPRIVIDNSLLAVMLKKTMFAAANDATRPELRCVNLSIDNGIIKITAADGYRVAVCTQKAEFIGEAVNGNFNIFKEEIQTALSVLKSAKLTIKYDSKNIEFVDGGETAVKVSLCANPFPNIDSIIKKNERAVQQQVTLISEELIETLQKTSVLPKSGLVPVKMRFRGDTATISYGSGLADFIDTLDCKLEGDPFVIGINDKYFLESLKNAAGDIVLNCNGMTGAIIFENGNTKHMIMPMRLKDEL